MQAVTETFSVRARIADKLKSIFKRSEKAKGKRLAFYSALFIAALIFFTIVNFDTMPLENKLKKMAYDKAGITLKIGKTGFSFPSGLTFENLWVNNLGPALNGNVDYLKVRLLVFSLLKGSPSLRFYAEKEGGELTLDFAGRFEKGGKVEIDIESVKFPIHKALIPEKGELPVDIFLTSSGRFTVPEGDIQKLEGEIKFAFFDLKLDSLFPGGNLGKMISPKEATCKVTVHKRKLTTKNCFAETKLGRVNLKVTTMLAKRMEKTPLSGFIVISKPSGILKTVLSVNTKLLRPDGSYRIPLRGTFEKPRLDI